MVYNLPMYQRLCKLLVNGYSHKRKKTCVAMLCSGLQAKLTWCIYIILKWSNINFGSITVPHVECLSLMLSCGNACSLPPILGNTCINCYRARSLVKVPQAVILLSEVPRQLLSLSGSGAHPAHTQVYPCSLLLWVHM